MTKKHFIALADHIRLADGSCVPRFTKGQIEYIAEFLQRQNSSFNRERWLGYVAGTCGPNGGRLR